MLETYIRIVLRLYANRTYIKLRKCDFKLTTVGTVSLGKSTPGHALVKVSEIDARWKFST